MKTRAPKFRTRSQPITNIAPTRRGMSWPTWAFLIFMRRVSKLRMARELEFIHFARWQRVRSKKLPRLSPLQPAEDFTNDFFLFATNYNGDWNQYIDTFARVPRIRRGMWWLWRFSQGYPGPFPIRTFKDWIHYHTYPELFYYVAYPRSTVRNIEAALRVKSEIDDFVEASTKAESATQFKDRYLAMVRKIAPHLGSAGGLSQTPTVAAATASPQQSGTRYTADTSNVGVRRQPNTRSKNRPLLGPILGRLSHRYDNSQSFITALSPIEAKPSHELTDGIIDLITELNTGPGPTPFSLCPMLHMARMVIIDDLRPALGVTGFPSLRSNYLLFLADLDGPVADFLDCLYEADPEFVNKVWGTCLGYPSDRSGPVHFRRYMERCSLPVHLPFVAFRDCTVQEIRGALEIHVNLLEWMANDHSAYLNSDELQKAWQAWLNQFVVGAGEGR